MKTERYYMRDSETNELWCLDYKFLSGSKKLKSEPIQSYWWQDRYSLTALVTLIYMLLQQLLKNRISQFYLQAGVVRLLIPQPHQSRMNSQTGGLQVFCFFVYTHRPFLGVQGLPDTQGVVSLIRPFPRDHPHLVAREPWKEAVCLRTSRYQIFPRETVSLR